MSMPCANQIDSSLVLPGTGLGIAGASPQRESLYRALVIHYDAFEGPLMFNVDPVSLCFE